MPQIMRFYAAMLALGAFALVLAVNGPVLAQKNPAKGKEAPPEPAPDPALDAFKAAKKDYDAAKKDDSPTGMKVAIEKMQKTNHPEAAKFLLKELQADQDDRKKGRPGLVGNTRKELVLALSKFTDEDSVKMIGEAALKLNSDPKAKGDERLALDQFDFFLALAAMQNSAAADNTLRAAIKHETNPYVKVAAIEAARQAVAKRFIPDVIAVLKEPNPEWAKVWTIVPLNVFACLELLIDPADRATMLTTVEATVAYEERLAADKLKSDERVRYFGGRMLRKLTGEHADMAAVGFWKWWIEQFKQLGKRPPADAKKADEKRSKTAPPPPVFDAAPVGKRFVFVIDVSKSMELPLKITLEEIEKRRKDREGTPTTGRGEKKPEEKKEGENKEGEQPAPQPPEATPPAPGDGKAGSQKFRDDPVPQGGRGEDSPLRKLPWESIGTRIELARHELARSIKSLAVVPDKDSKGKIDREFAIITYSTEVKCITNGWVVATPDNCDRWAAEALKLEPEHLTNIFGGLMKAMRLSAKGDAAAEPSVDRDCVMTGADSVIFLTDGWASWDDFSTSQSVKDPRGGEGMVGDGQFILGEKIWPEIVRQNLFRKVIINTVGIGAHDFRLLRKLASETGGVYVDWGFKE